MMYNIKLSTLEILFNNEQLLYQHNNKFYGWLYEHKLHGISLQI